MAIPVEIRQVERPKNTVVKNYFGKFKVVKRTSKYVNGKVNSKRFGNCWRNSRLQICSFWNTYPSSVQDLRKIKKKLI